MRYRGVFVFLAPLLANAQAWTEWGQNAQHTGTVSVSGQRAVRSIFELTYDPFVAQEQAEFGGDLVVHYQAPLADGNDLFMEFKTGTWVPCVPPGSQRPFPCGVDAWNSQIWGEKRYISDHGRLFEQWSFQSDWKPEPSADGLGGWEPVFHAVLEGNFVYVPGFGGGVIKLNRLDGSIVTRINPFPAGNGSSANVFVAGPLVADSAGNIYYNAIQLDLSAGLPFSTDVRGGWLVKITPDDRAAVATFASLTVGAPRPSDQCLNGFTVNQLPWPPAPNATPNSSACGSQRPGINVAPAVAPDGSIYTVSRAHFNSSYSYVVAVNPDLSPRWHASLRGRLQDGCGTPTLPPNGTPGGCRAGATLGVDPRTNQPPAGQVNDDGSSSPVVAPDGSILYGAYTRFNYARGHLFKFSPNGDFLASYDFGWDITPAVYSHDGTYSIVLKDNHYDIGSYCSEEDFCPTPAPGPYYITQLAANLKPEWSYQSTNTFSCQTQADGSTTCTSDHPNGFEWCINAPAVDRDGKVYANSEDGHLYVLKQGGQLDSALFLNLAIGAAYTPLSIGPDGTIYAQNDGRLFVVGNGPRRPPGHR
jgi:outer membrane protein assembly factor BamB